MAVTSKDRTLRCVAVCAAAVAIGGCGGGGGDDGGGAPAPPASGWVAGSFLPSATFVGRCVSPRSGTNPANGLPYTDIQRQCDRREQLAALVEQRALPLVQRDHRSRSRSVCDAAVLRRHLEDLRDDAVRQPQRSLPLHLPDFGLARARAIGHGSGLRRRLVRHRQHAAAADRRGLYASELARDRAGSQPATRRGSVVHRRRRRRQHQHASHGRYVRCRALSGSAGRESHVRAAQSSDGLAANRDADVRERDDRSGAERQHDQHANRQRRLHTVQRSPPGGRAAAHRRVRATGRSERHGSRSRPALQRRRFAGDRQRGRLHDRRHGADGRADVRELALQRQAHGHQPDHRRSADADAVLRRFELRATAADSELAARLRAHGRDDVLGQRVDHQWAARRQRGSHPDRLDDVRQAVRLLSAGQLQHDVLHDPDDRCQRDGFRRVRRRLLAE